MNLEILPQVVQRFVAETGLESRIAGTAPICGDYADQNVIDRFLLPRRQNLLLSHYTSWDRLEQALNRCSFCMRRVDQSAGDNRSGSFPTANLHSASAMDADLQSQFPTADNKGAVFASGEVHRIRAYEHCWFEGWKENPEMWKNYGWDGRGVCIQARSWALFEAASQTSPEFNIMIGGCFYRNDDEPIPTIIGSLPLFCKRRQFEGENEVRLIADINEKQFRRNGEELQWVPLRHMEFIDRIILGPKLSENEASIVRDKAKQVLPRAAVLSSITVASELD